MKKPQIAVIECDSHLYSEFGPTTQADAYVCLDTRDGRLYCASDAGPVPSAVDRATDRGLVRRWPVAALTQRAANALLRRVQPMAERLLAGDGDADDEIDDACRDAGEVVEDVVVCEDAEDWFGPISADEQREQWGITPETSDDRLREIAVEVQREAAAESPPVVLRGLGHHLQLLRTQA